MRLKFMLPILAVITLGLVACESDEDNKIADAQECLDALRSNGNGDAQACIDKVSGITSAHSYIIRCNASFYIGGITTATIVQALQDYDAAPAAAKEATLVTALVQTDDATHTTPDPVRSDITYSYCEKTQIPGLVYMATLSNMGTIIDDASASMNPADMVDDCIVTPGSCNDTAIGQMAVTMTDLYCKGDATESQICKDLESAIANAPDGDYDAIAQNIFTYFTN